MVPQQRAQMRVHDPRLLFRRLPRDRNFAVGIRLDLHSQPLVGNVTEKDAPKATSRPRPAREYLNLQYLPQPGRTRRNSPFSSNSLYFFPLGCAAVICLSVSGILYPYSV